MNSNEDQRDYWNNAGAARWVAHQEALDAMVRPFGEAVLARLAPRQGEHALDVGCGCGETLLALARAVGPSGSVTGIDLSQPMLARARERIPTAELVAGDASAHTFQRKFDVLFSRFGVMFFADPEAAFRHLVASLAPGGRLGFVCWRDLSENPWASVPVAAVRSVLPDLPPPFPTGPGAPGPFSFAAAARLREVLQAAGLSAVEIEPFDADIELSTQGVTDAAAFALTTGPASRLFAEATPEQQKRVVDGLAETLAPHLSGGRVALRGGAWTVLARV